MTGVLPLLTAIAFALTAGFVPKPAGAAEGDWVKTDVVSGRLISSVQAMGTLEQVPAGLHVRLQKGWKINWRTPGDAGLAPSLDWHGSTNVAGADLSWPAPKRFNIGGIEAFGYQDEVVLPLSLSPGMVGEPMALRAKVDMVACSNICVPVTLDLALDLPSGSAHLDPDPARNIAEFLSRVPGQDTATGLKAISMVAIEADGRQVLKVVVDSETGWEKPDLFVEELGGQTFQAPSLEFADTGRRLIAYLVPKPGGAAPPTIAGLKVKVTIVDGTRLAEVDSNPLPLTYGKLPSANDSTLAWMLLMALAGGAILNFMPCVLPVLSLKLLSLAKPDSRNPRAVRKEFAATAAGIIAAILAIGLVVAVLKTGGSAVGWGLHFQQPGFLAFMILVLTVFGASLTGAFNIPLPARLGDAIQKVTDHPGLLGHFATGVFAALLATPCSAPILGTAVGFALSRGVVEILAIFLMLGIGLALPYFLLVIFPRAASLMPRPGRWMVSIKLVLAVMLFGSALWLLWVLAAQRDAIVAATVATMAVLMASSLALARRLGQRGRVAVGMMAVFFAAGALATPVAVKAPSEIPAADRTAWEPFDETRISSLVKDGKVVFVDVTAEWCISCKANKLLVIDRPTVAALLSQEDVVAMRADWTKPDDQIARYLARNRRYAIPFNAVYGPGALEGIVLSELLTEGAIIDAVTKARRLEETNSR